MRTIFKTLMIVCLIIYFSSCTKTEIEQDNQQNDNIKYYFKAKIDGIDSEAETMGMSSFGENFRWIVAENGSGGFHRGAVGLKIHKDYLKVGSYTLNSYSKDKYIGEFYTRTYGEVDSIYSTSNTLTNGILKIDTITDYAETNSMKVMSGRFAFYATEIPSNRGITITYGEFKILAHSAFFNN